MMRRQSRGRRLVDMANPQDVVPPIGNPLDIPGCILWLRADLGVTVVQGPVVATGTTPPTVTMTGTPASSTNTLEIDITLTGLRGTATFTWKLNGVVQQTLQLTAATFVLGATGITANFSAGTYTNDNVYKSVVTVSAWADQSTAGNNVIQATAANQPAFVANGINGQPTFQYNGTSQFLAAAAMTIAPPFSALMVGQAAGSGGIEMFWSFANSVFGYVYSTSSDASIELNYGGAQFAGTGSNKAPCAITAIVNGASSSVRDNGVSSGIGSLGAGTSSNLCVGSLGASDFLGKYESELVMYNRAISVPEQRALFAYVASRYGISA